MVLDASGTGAAVTGTRDSENVVQMPSRLSAWPIVLGAPWSTGAGWRAFRVQLPRDAMHRQPGLV